MSYYIQAYNLILIPALFSVLFVVVIGYFVLSVYKNKEKKILNSKIKTIISFILFVLLLISEVFYAIIIYLSLQKLGITEVELTMFLHFITMSVLALILKFFIGYYFFQKIPFNDDYNIQQGGWLGKIISKSRNIVIPERKGYSHRGGPLIVFMILGISIVEFVGILGLISAFKVLNTLN